VNFYGLSLKGQAKGPGRSLESYTDNFLALPSNSRPNKYY